MRALMTLLTSIATVGTTAANTALAPTLGKLEAYLKDSTKLHYCVPNEYICAKIGQFLGLPIPTCGLVCAPGKQPEHYFASLNFNLLKSALPPVDPAVCASMFEGTGVVLFDILIANGDRHRNNLSLDITTAPNRLTVFDHSHALFGHVNGNGRNRLITLRDHFGIARGHCILDALASDKHFREWITRIQRLPDYLIEQVCDATVPLNMISGAEALEVKSFLKHRKAEIENIVKANKTEFTAIHHWSLF